MTRERELAAEFLGPDGLAAVLESLPLGAFLVEGSGRIMFVNAAAAELRNGPLRGVENIYELADLERFHPDGRPYGPHESPIGSALRGERVTGALVSFGDDPEHSTC